MNYKSGESDLYHKETLYLDSLKRFTKRKAHKENYNLWILEGVLKGITDIIKVFDSNGRILFFNEAGCKFYKKTKDEVKGKKCFEILNMKENCKDCGVEEALRTKKLIRIEKYFPEYNKFMDCTYNPVMNNFGEVVFIVEQQKDITKKKILANTIRESEERYRKVINLSPEAIIITVDSKIVLANHKACNLVGTDYDKIIGENIYKYVSKEFIKTAHRRMKQILEGKKSKSISDYKIVRYGNTLIDVEISASYLMYKGSPAIQAIIRNISDMKRRLNEASKLQRKYIEDTSPIPEKLQLESLYMPAKTVSGDFFRLYKVNEDLVLGIIGDVSGKGITAALNVLAFFVLFREAILISCNPLEIVKILNKKIADYLSDNHCIAACCFSLDFSKNEARVAGAGISQFMFQKSNCNPQELIVKGPFLGMFQDAVFDENVISFKEGDRFYFPTDGLDFIFNDNEIRKSYLKSHTLTEFINYLKAKLNDIINETGALKDDSTIIALEIK
ncbi:PAS domain S-box protein [Clostridium sp. AWRP]|uniref:SpoIIE family protein phosphatase n=1 Tax=Clostridium sp. AWRP TaxID=2212991 RepID=UPI000FDAD38A|nr:PAS domain S-box protein [Clostridium sp. AWRP]AZV55353.1 PAS domain S-box protein [Clostridium sp. AWRP]